MAIERILLNEYALKKIGALVSQQLVKGHPDILVAILGAGVDKSITDIQNALLDEYNYVEDSGKSGLSTTMAARFIIGAPDSEIAGVAPGVKLVSERVLGESGGGGYKTVIEGIKHAVHIGAKIIYLELGGPAEHAGLQQSINDAHSGAAD